MRRSLLALVIIGVVLAVAAPAAPDEADDALDFFRRRTIAADPQRIQTLIGQLGDESFPVRQKASTDLMTLGGRSLPALRRTLREAQDLETRNRAAVCVSRITNSFEAEPVQRAAGVVARLKPREAATVLLDYYPQITDSTAAEAVLTALAAVALRDGRVDPVLVRALREEPSQRRAAAGLALIRAGCRDHLDAVRQLLKDAEPEARLPIALTLINDKEKAAIPALISVLDQLPLTELHTAQEWLYRLAADDSPGEAFGATSEQRLRYRQAWEQWWNAHGATVDLAAATPAFEDRTLIVLLDEGEVVDLDFNDKERFKISNVAFPLDVQYLPGDRVLLAEHHGNKVTERHKSGTILWEKKFDGPLVAQRLPDGNTFIASRTLMAEVDRAGHDVWALPVPHGEELMRANKLPSGDIAVVLTDRARPRQRFLRMSPRGEERKAFPVQVSTYGGRIDVLPDGRVLVPHRTQNLVVEFDADGKSLREFSVVQPIAAVRLPNGHTIVTSRMEPGQPGRAVEFDIAGKEVWDLENKTRLTRCLRR